MCGLAGARGTGADVERMLDRIAHRGPDGRGVKDANGSVHGHVRLALFDPSQASAQPFMLGGATLSFNGEVWNFRDVRAQLEKRGRVFGTSGDTEVLAAALLEWGVDDALPRLDGMFAFAWSRGDEHVLVRDRYGKVPLYAVRRAGGFEWASERKAWEGDASGGAVPVPPGSVLDLVTGRLRRWYRLPDRADAINLVAELRASVRARLQADAPVCVLASGGLDSTLILSLAREVSKDVVAYAAVLDDRSTDAEHARLACREMGVELREVEIASPREEDLVVAVRVIEVPSKAQVEIAAMCIPLARAIARDGFKACLSGEGADELFCGYGNMMIRASQEDDDGYQRVKREALEKMARGNFVRCNKAFMAAGVEVRLPYLARPIVEMAVLAGKAQSPPGKKLLKEAARGLVPARVISRPKETFQGASGMSAAAAALVSSPTRFYNAECVRAFGKLVNA